MTDAWPPLVLAGLGAFHGLNPAMGWLFAVALGLHRRSRTVVFVSLLPIALGHAASIAAVAGLLVTAGFVVPQNLVKIGSGIGFGMQTGLLGLGVWSFLMATAHGAGLMLWPALMPLCFPTGPATATSGGPVVAALAGVGVHSLAMILTTAVIAAIVHGWLGVGVLRNAWLNVDLLWTFALVATGALLLFV